MMSPAQACSRMSVNLFMLVYQVDIMMELSSHLALPDTQHTASHASMGMNCGWESSLDHLSCGQCH